MTVSDFLNLLEGVNRLGDGWMGRCPAHNDDRASLSIGEGEAGQVLLHCHAGCTLEEITTEVGIQVSDLFPDAPGEEEWTPHGPAVAVYDYVDEHGELLFQVARTAEKQFPCRRPDVTAKTGWRWKLGDTRRVLYRLPRVLEAVAAGETIYVVEGEKDVAAIEEAGATATCNPGGAGKWRAEYAETLRGATVLVIADSDDAGRKHAAEVVASLEGVAASVKLGEPLDGKDAADHLEAGFGLVDFLPTSEGFEIQSVENPVPPAQDDEDVVDGETLIADLIAFIRRFLFITDNQAIALGFYVLHTHTFPAAQATPYVHVSAPSYESGKSRVLDVFEGLVSCPLPTSNASNAAIFRSIKPEHEPDYVPTLLFDEVDSIFPRNGKASEGSEELRNLLNAGYQAGKPVLRCVGEGKNQRPERFDVFCPKVLAGVGRLPRSLATRSLPIRMKKKTKDEHVDRLRLRTYSHDARPLYERAARWAKQNLEALQEATPTLPEELTDRQQDVSEPLLAIAERIAGYWPDRLCNALIDLFGGSALVEDDEKARLLGDIRDIFDRLGCDRLTTKKLLAELREVEGAPWHQWWSKRVEDPDKSAAMKLANRLRDFDIRANEWQEGGHQRGYLRAQFEEVWKRHLPPEQPASWEGWEFGSTMRDSGAVEVGSGRDPSQPNRTDFPHEQAIIPTFPTSSPGGTGNGDVTAKFWERLRRLPDTEVRRLLDTYRPELVGRKDITHLDERRQIAALYLAYERAGEAS